MNYFMKEISVMEILVKFRFILIISDYNFISSEFKRIVNFAL